MVDRIYSFKTCQFGFQRRSASGHAVTYFSDSQRTKINKTGAVFVELREAFGTIGYATFLAQLPRSGEMERNLHGLKITHSIGNCLYPFKVHAPKYSQSRLEFLGSILGSVLFKIVI